MKDILKASLSKGLVTKHLDLSTEIEASGAQLKREISRIFGRSFHIREVDTGSCGGCESEIIAVNNPIYDIQRFGIDFVASPRHADALLVTGPLSRNMLLALKKTYDAMPSPKFVITLGDCALDGGCFKDSYYCLGKIGDVLPVNLHIPGCPPNPGQIIKYLYSFLKNRSSSIS
ncbi:MAG: NADH-quinone oxidoreductase subunit B family protein [Candidatus Omnitrophica bacterium]|nr:NADH-quinone oxidoreductase subunit B family protein [Candidatus Omnitrophota bacterium]